MRKTFSQKFVLSLLSIFHWCSRNLSTMVNIDCWRLTIHCFRSYVRLVVYVNHEKIIEFSILLLHSFDSLLKAHHYQSLPNSWISQIAKVTPHLVVFVSVQVHSVVYTPYWVIAVTHRITSDLQISSFKNTSSNMCAKMAFQHQAGTAMKCLSVCKFLFGYVSVGLLT